MRESINDDVTRYFKKKEIACTKSSNKCCYPGCIFNFPAENCNTKDCKGMLHQISQNEYDKKYHESKLEKKIGLRKACYVCFEKLKSNCLN